jgi:CRP-like cAMP-binding protein
MTEVLLEELLDSDINWMIQQGQRQQLSANHCLIRQGQSVDAFYIVLEGSLVAAVADDLSIDPDLGQALIQFSVGDIVGETTFLRSVPSAVTVQSLEGSSVLRLPYAQLQIRLSQDPAFACRFYRAIAILLLKRFEQLLDKFSRRRGLQVSLMQDGPVLFGELHDGDVDWMVEQGRLEEAHANQVLLQAGRAVEKLYVVLYGELSMTVLDKKRSDLNEIFSQVSGAIEPTGRQIAQVGKGEMVGESALLASHLSNFMVKAQEPALLLALPRSQLALKLQQDAAMGSRFYRVLALLMAHRLDGLISRLSYGSLSYSAGQTLSTEVQYDNEFDFDTLDNLTIGGARFDWMLKRLKVRGA